jgi:hypothetical protein
MAQWVYEERLNGLWTPSLADLLSDSSPLAPYGAPVDTRSEGQFTITGHRYAEQARLEDPPTAGYPSTVVAFEAEIEVLPTGKTRHSRDQCDRSAVGIRARQSIDIGAVSWA